ncbi:DUF3598 family protein [Calothrix sp. FACHB-1219]|uniref:DUF3598 family protein n=1 Tax=unclassified Calothrix TaxID=2619626 RepID=UPI0016896F30|nr:MULTISPECIES: DUF3598 family protein [unclassified Calothrix]MBD2206222.1 DUF3598 family protein [Calothrix sp. FACHB-168]MBD2221067.1 DUF3598 family protein [Calothrix sp. FACHB-1219]
MTSQWERLLLNLGAWEGSFIRFSPQGELIADVKSVVSLEGLNNNQTVRQIVRRQGQEDLVLEYSSLGKSTLFLENGAFSQGSIQLAPFSEFGAELGLIHENRRLRLVQLFDKNGQLSQLTLIPEHLAGTETTPSPTVQVNDLLGEWRGEAITSYTDLRSPTTTRTTLKLELDAAGRFVQSLSFGQHTITSSATIKGSIIHFDQDPQKQMQVLLLSHGASATSPLKVNLRQSFILEAGWLIKPNLRQRMIRSYSDKGEWVSLTLITEEKV